MTEEDPNTPARSRCRSWKVPGGVEWRVWLEPAAESGRTGKLVFVPNPKQEMGCPKILVRGLSGVHQIPERRLPFYLRAAQSGGFVWRDRDGVSWHIWLRAHMLSTTGRRLEIHHPRSHRALWEMPDQELQKLVDQAVTEGSGERGDQGCADATP